MNSSFEPLLSDSAAGELLQLHPKTVQRMARRGDIPAFRIGKFWRYRASELESWLMLHSQLPEHSSAQHRKDTVQ